MFGKTGFGRATGGSGREGGRRTWAKALAIFWSGLGLVVGRRCWKVMKSKGYMRIGKVFVVIFGFYHTTHSLEIFRFVYSVKLGAVHCNGGTHVGLDDTDHVMGLTAPGPITRHSLPHRIEPTDCQGFLPCNLY